MLWTLFNDSDHLNSFRQEKVGLIALVPEEEYSIRELAESVAGAFGLKNVKFDPSKPDGQFRKTMSNATLRRLLPGFKFTPLDEGIRATVSNYISS